MFDFLIEPLLSVIERALNCHQLHIDDTRFSLLINYIINRREKF